MTNKTKIKAIVAATLFAVVTIVGHFNKKESPRNLTLSDLAVTSDANAECQKVPNPTADGRCQFGMDFCIYAIGYDECDPYRNYY